MGLATTTRQEQLMPDPHGLYWVRPLLDTLAVTACIVGMGALLVFLALVASPRAERNRAKRRYARNLAVGMRDLNARYSAMLHPSGVIVAHPVRTDGTVAPAGPISRTDVRTMLGFLDQAVAHGELSEAHRPHVLVALDEGVVGPCSGPFEDLWQATAAAAPWEAMLNQGMGEDGQPLVEVLVVPLFAPGT